MGVAAIIVSAVALLISAYEWWDRHKRTVLHVVPGKLARLYVFLEPEQNPPTRPVIFASIQYSNAGGKATTIFDTKLSVRCSPRPVDSAYAADFRAAREVQNFLLEGEEIDQRPVIPVFVEGRRSEVRSYAFAPVDYVDSDRIPDQFDLQFNIYTQDTKMKWRDHGSYTVKNVSDVWKDLDSGPPFKAKVVGVLRAS